MEIKKFNHFIQYILFRTNFLQYKRLLKGNRHIILMFHRIISDNENLNPFDSCPADTEKAFKAVIEYLIKDYKIVTLNELVDNLDSSVKLATITFDDGWKDNYDYAYPILKQFQIPATIFIATDKIGGKEPFWQQLIGEYFHTLHFHMSQNENDKLKKLIFGDCKIPFTSYSYHKAIMNLKKMDKINFEKVIENVKKNKEDTNETDLGEERLFLNRHEILEMSRSNIEFGSHSHNHLILTNESSRTVEKDLARSKNIIEEILRSKVHSLSYPNGNTSNSIVNIAKKVGFKCGCVTHISCVSKKANRMMLPRIHADWGELVDKNYELKPHSFEWVIR